MITTTEIIQKYPKIFQDYEGNPHRVNWYDVPDGWLAVIDILCGSIQDYIDNTWRYTTGGNRVSPAQVTCTQMKEKFGGLRFYVNNSDEQIEGMIRMAEFMCEHICQKCGSKENIGQTQGWIATLCGTCGSDVITWKPYKQESNEA
jgi:hypothetical protein